MEVLKLTKEQRNEVYLMAQIDHLNDLETCNGTNYRLDGMCGQLEYALDAVYGLDRKAKLGELLPEFAAMKPKNKEWREFWWKTDNHLTTRTKKYELLIKQTS